MQQNKRFFAAITLAVFILMSLFSTGCAANGGAASTTALESTAEATPTSEPTPTPSPTPVPTPAISLEQKKMMIWMGEDYAGYMAVSIFVFYAELNGEGRLIWTTKEATTTPGIFDFYDAFNRELLFQITIPTEDQLKANPNTYPKYISAQSDSFKQFTVITSCKLLDIYDAFAKNSLSTAGVGDPYAAVSSYIDKDTFGTSLWTKEEMLNAYIDSTPTQYLLPFWEYVPNAVKPDNFDNPPSPTPTATPMPALSREQAIELLGIDDDFEAGYLFGQISVYYYLLNGSKRIIWAVDYYGTQDGTTDAHSLFNGEYLFSYYLDPENTPANLSYTEVFKYYSACSPMLDGMHLLGSGTLSDLIYNYQNWDIPYNGNELLDKVKNDSLHNWDAFDADMQIPLLKDELIGLYLELTPPEYIPPFWEYVPGAVTPDSFLTPAP